MVTVNATPLLLSMLGATRTDMSPDVAPVGIVTVIDVALHELMVTGASFNTTVLPLCEAPNPEPDITTCVPTGPVVADSPVITGGASVVELTETLSKYPVYGLFAEPRPNASPM